MSGPQRSRILVHPAHDVATARVLQVLGPDACSVAVSRSAFLNRLDDARAGVVLLSHGSETVPSWIREATRAHHLVVVAPLDPGTVRSVWPLRLDADIVWWEEMEERLPDVVSRGDPDAPLTAIHEAFRARAMGRPFVLRVLDRVLGGEASPPTTVSALARELRVAPSTLRYHWKSALGDVPLKSLLDWLVLLEALRIHADMGWSAVAYRLGVHTRTLDRISRRLTGRSAADARRNRDAVVTAFRAWVAPWVGVDDPAARASPARRAPADARRGTSPVLPSQLA